MPQAAAAQGVDSIPLRKSYLIPALEIVAFDGLLNLFDRAVLGSDYKTHAGTIKRNLRRSWVVEDDPYEINQFGHPYQGSIYHGFARASGLNYWEALLYTFIGSALWEIAGERTPPSRNDQIASGIAGTFFGESLFRIGSLLLENAHGEPGTLRQTAVAVAAPWLSFNRGVFGRRFDRVFSSNGAAYYRRFQLGAATAIQSERGTSTGIRPNEALVEASIEYGLPGAPGYEYRRPFDYFALQATGSSAAGFESILSRGLIAGRPYGAGEYQGVWGLYGGYDYVAPQVFRISTTSLSLGTTGQWSPGRDVALQLTALAGTGYAAVGTLRGAEEGDYHYGLAPQAIVTTRLILGDRASLDLSGREYYVSDVAAATSTAGHDNIARVEASLTVRLHEQRALSLRYLWSRRDARYPDLGARTQQRGTLGIFLTFLGNDRFGAVMRDLPSGNSRRR
jgi:hypothetical protein